MRTDLRLLRVDGPDARSFLNGLITQRTDLPPGSGAYAALLSPQGKLLADFPLLSITDNLMILALAAGEFEGIVKKLSLFKLRSHVTLSQDLDHTLITQIGEPKKPFTDGRHPDLSHDLVRRPAQGELIEGGCAESFHRARAHLGVPEGCHDLLPQKSTLLDEGLACAIDWKKGCYMGQEVTARMHYRALIKRVLVPYQGHAEPGQILRSEDKKIGEIRSSYGNIGFAYVIKDYAEQTIEGISLGRAIAAK